MSAPESLITRRPPSDCNRILSMLRKGPLTQAAFDGPVAADGWDPIPQIARRIGDLRKRGHDIRTDDVRGEGYCTYTLISEPSHDKGRAEVGAHAQGPVVNKRASGCGEMGLEQPPRDGQATLFDLPGRTYGYEEAA